MEEMREITCKVICGSSIIPIICTPHFAVYLAQIHLTKPTAPR